MFRDSFPAFRLRLCHNFNCQKHTDDFRSSHRCPAANAGVAKIAPSSLFVARTFNFVPASNHRHHALGGGNVDPLVGSHGEA